MDMNMIALIKGLAGKGGGGSSGGGVLVVHEVEVEDDPGKNRLDKTWQEIFDADLAVIKKSSNETELYTHYVKMVDVYDGAYEVEASNETLYVATSASDYPVNGGK